ncbi:uncharacterized protein Z519_10954 [Cladophialophora bantiana CBS 173.52]|uniref:FMN-dependent dehydrogenase domain-containing protein n=1 Tax=Cladophialophora bantiana (strain ATCC 10958 / CBS 173.52 / CDC B-1940 / NIH 8579) TaxID=1442370 RepID=A0A0D2HBT8_CLAB1|nr:uncharacterized protein Z519_10954 [Cladophialophora bantiana CBS 173.52]KIW88385.1 hypothetical protein Z519_10954 [Cladophialophora bantiana CBS 173.52]
MATKSQWIMDPISRTRFKDKHGVGIEEDEGKAAAEWTRTAFPGMIHSWDDINPLKEHCKGTIILKGIQGVPDALKAVEVGVQGIVRDIFLDSGFRYGADIAKPMALGARSYTYVLVLGGEEGVGHTLGVLCGDLDLTLHLAGIPLPKFISIDVHQDCL